MSLEKVYMEITNQCNLNCNICYRSNWKEKIINMSYDLIDKCYNDIRKIDSIKTIVLGGIGEPMNHKLFNEVIDKYSDYNLILTTNGTLFNENINDKIVDKINKVVISVDGIKKTHEKIRNCNFDLILDNINSLNKHIKNKRLNNITISIQSVLSKENINELFDIIDLACALNISELIVSNLVPQNQLSANIITYSKYKNNEIMSLFNKARNYSFRKGLNVKFPNYELKTERRCNFIDNNSTYIKSNGDIVPCYRFSHHGKEFIFGREKYVNAFSFGNIIDKSLIDIWESKIYENFRKIVYNNHYPSCIDCDLSDGCDLAKNSDVDCYGIQPSCGDCLWSRRMVFCP